LAATASHLGDWLNASLPIASCGLRLDDEAVRVAVALHLRLGVCVPHSRSCGENVDAWDQHAFVCKHAPGRTQRHHALNNVIARSFASAGIPVSKEPTGIYRDGVKRPDGVTLVTGPCLGTPRLQPLWQTPTSQPVPSLQLLQLML